MHHPSHDHEGEEKEEEPASNFRFQGKYLLLTYARTGSPDHVYEDDGKVADMDDALIGHQLPGQGRKTNKQLPRLTKQMVVDHLKKFAHLISGYSLTEEHHTLGGLHIHLVLEFSKRWDCKNARFWDIPVDGGDYHPNWRSLKNKSGLNEGLKYIRKEDKDPFGTLVPKGIYNDLAMEGKIEEAIKDFRKAEPARYAMHKEQIEKNFYEMGQERKTLTQEIKWKLDDFKGLTNKQRDGS